MQFLKIADEREIDFLSLDCCIQGSKHAKILCLSQVESVAVLHMCRQKQLFFFKKYRILLG